MKYFGVVPSARELGLRVLANDEVVDILSKLHLPSAIEQLSKINISLCLGGTTEGPFQWFLAKSLHGEDTYSRLASYARKPEVATFFHPGMLRACLKLAWQHADAADG